MAQNLPPPYVSSTPQRPEPQESRFDLRRIVMIAAGALIGLVILIFIIALLLSRGDVDNLGSIIQVVRDLIIIFLALEGIMIVLALAVLILQVARLINLLQNDVKPVLKDTQQTVQSAKGTVIFVGDAVGGPIIKASAFMAGVGSLVGNVGGIRKAIRRTVEDAQDAAEAS